MKDKVARADDTEESAARWWRNVVGFAIFPQMWLSNWVVEWYDLCFKRIAVMFWEEFAVKEKKQK